MIEKLKEKIDFKINSIQFVKRDGLKFLDIELPDIDLKTIENKSKIISKIIDQIDQSDENYYLNIFSSGTEKEIEIKNINLFIGENIFVEINKHLLDKNKWEGELIENNKDEIVLKINNKGRFQKIKIKKDNILFIKVTAKIRKVKN